MSESFRNALCQHGIRLAPENVFPGEKEFLKARSRLWKEGIDGLFCSLDEPRIRTLLEALSGSRQGASDFCVTVQTSAQKTRYQSWPP